MPSRHRILERTVIAAAIAGPMLYALVLNMGAIGLPPAWDSAGTVAPAALTMVELDWDIWQVAQLPPMLQGGPSTHATSLYTIALALLIAAFGPSTGFFVAHLSSIALVAALTGATYLLARGRASIRVSALVALTVGILPVVVQQSADIYLDLPLAVVTTLACWTTFRRRFWWTALLVFIGVGIKTSGVFLLPLLLLAKKEEEEWAPHLAKSALAGLVAVVPFGVAFATTDRFDTIVTGEVREILVRSSSAMLVLTVDVFLILIFFGLVMYGRLRGRSLDRMSTIAGVAVVGFVAIHLATILLSGTIALLPRYYIAILPVALVAAIPNATSPGPRFGRKLAIASGLLAALAVFSILNHRGDFYPLPDHEFYVIAERSTRAQDLLELQISGTRRLVATGLPVIVGTQDLFRLAYPEMGYVEARPDEVILVIGGLPEELPDSFAMLIERRSRNSPLVAVEREAVVRGYYLTYEVLSRGGYESELIVATKPHQ